MKFSITHAIPVYAPAWQFGGPVLSVSRLCEALAKAQQRVKVLTTDTGLNTMDVEAINQPITREGVEVTYYAAQKNSSTIRSQDLIDALPNALQGADLVHLSAIWQPLGIPIQRAAYALDIPILHSLRGALGPYSRRKKWWKKTPYYWLQERPWLQRAAGIHVTTHQEMKEIEMLNLRAPCYLLPNSIDLEQLKLDPEAGFKWRIENQIGLAKPLLIICGRQHHKKGLDLIPKILELIQNKDWHLGIIGNDDDGSGKALKSELRNLGFHHRITELPNQPASKLCPIYNAADLLLLPSRHENFGNVVIEALACGCAVMTSDNTGVGGDLLKDAPPNFGAVLPRTPEIWANWLEAWLQQPQRAGTQSALWAAQRFSSSAVAKQAIAIYQDILEAHR